MLCALDLWTHNLDTVESLDVAYLDLSKVFDVVPQQRLLQEIHRLHGGVDTEFLKDRQQKVFVKGSSLVWQPVLIGVPQGSVLGPVLFSIYINNHPDISTCPNSLFATTHRPTR